MQMKIRHIPTIFKLNRMGSQSEILEAMDESIHLYTKID